MSDYVASDHIRDDILNFLLSTPTPEKIIAFHASDMAQERLRYLLDTNRNGTLTDDERAELEEASQLNHLITLLKARAHQAQTS